MTAGEGKYLSFILAGEQYGIDILKVLEIITMVPVTRVPRTSEFEKGVINLRGKVIPVVDLRLRIGMQAGDYTKQACIIIVIITEETSDVMIGIVVDEVMEVLDIKAEEIEDTPALGMKLETEYILGMAKTEGNITILIDIDQVLTSNGASFIKN